MLPRFVRPCIFVHGDDSDADARTSSWQRPFDEVLEQLRNHFPVLVPRFMAEVVEQMSIQARKSKWVDQDSGVSARFGIANYKTMISSARRRAIMLAGEGEPTPAVPASATWPTSTGPPSASSNST